MAKKICLIFFYFIIFICITSNVSAYIAINIDVNPLFVHGDEIMFDYLIMSDGDENIKFIPKIVCSDVPEPPLDIKTIFLEKDFTYKNIYYFANVNSLIKSQNCEAIIEVLEPFKLIKKEPFKVETLEIIDFNLLLCKDHSCLKKSKIFLINEQIYFDYDSDVEPEISAVLIYPEGKRENIIIPISVKASQIGTYTLEVSASKEGYKTQTVKKQFGVIEKNVEIRSSSVFGRDDSQDSTKSKPSSKITDLDKKYAFYIFVGVIAALMVLVIVFIIYLKNKKCVKNIIS